MAGRGSGAGCIRQPEVFLRFQQLLFVLIALFIPALLAQEAPASQPTPAAAPAEKPKKSTITGRVINSKTGEAVKKANVMLMKGGGGPKTTSAESDASGNFTFVDVEPGTYTLMCDRQGFARQFYGARNNPYIGATLTVAAGQD